MADTPQVGVSRPRGGEVMGVTPTERQLIQRVFSNPLEVPPLFKGWLEAYLEPKIKELIDSAIGKIPTYTPPAWQSYTPTWTASAGTPAINNGTLAGRYVQTGKTVIFTVELTYGSTTTGGTAGAYWRFTYPVPARVPSGQVNPIILGSGYVEDLSLAAYVVQVRTESIPGYVVFDYVTPTVQGGVGATTPFTFATGDFLRLCATYEAA